MIQRIQTVYLLLIACLMVIMLFVPVTNNISYSWLLMINAGITAILAVVTIFLYKKRKNQIRLCNLILCLLVLFYVITFISAIGISLDFSVLKSSFCYTILFPLIAMILDILAIRGIKHDEKLIRSTDRLR